MYVCVCVCVFALIDCQANIDDMSPSFSFLFLPLFLRGHAELKSYSSCLYICLSNSDHVFHVLAFLKV